MLALCYLDGTVWWGGMVMAPPSCFLHFDRLLCPSSQEKPDHPLKVLIFHPLWFFQKQQIPTCLYYHYGTLPVYKKLENSRDVMTD